VHYLLHFGLVGTIHHLVTRSLQEAKSRFRDLGPARLRNSSEHRWKLVGSRKDTLYGTYQFWSKREKALKDICIRPEKRVRAFIISLPRVKIGLKIAIRTDVAYACNSRWNLSRSIDGRNDVDL